MARQSPVSLSAAPPTQIQRRLAGLLAIALLAGCVLILLFQDRVLTPEHTFIPVVDAVLLLSSLLTAALLYAQFSLLRMRGLLALASGYTFVSLIIGVHLLSFAAAPHSAWLTALSHLGLPAAIVGYALLKHRDEHHAVRAATRSQIAASVLGVCAAVAVLSWMVFAFAEPLLTMAEATRSGALRSDWIAAPAIALSFAAVALMWYRRSSALDLWVMLVAWACLIDSVLLAMPAARFSLLWYADFLFSMVASGIMLLVLLHESTVLHAQLARAIAAETREREATRTTVEVVLATLAHELHQPLCAIAANGSAASAMLARKPPDLVEIGAALNDIADDARRASEIIDSARSPFTRTHRGAASLDVGEIVRDVIAALQMEIDAHGVTVHLEIAADVPAIRGDEVQLRQVIVHLVTNALESIAACRMGARSLRIRVRREPDRVALMVEDSGAGFRPKDAERIFKSFVTTKQTGMGMGLAICRSIIEAHGGQIWAVPRSPRGAVFHCVLPVISGVHGAARSRASVIEPTSALESSHSVS
ncbi:MAG TPA: ATP-binding protein [Steroidobacteraceae bacterium]